jgi:hypothetical protein
VTLQAATAVSGPAGVELSLTWRVTTPPPPDLTVFVHGLAGGTLVAQADGDPMAGIYPFWQWAAGGRAQEQRRLPAGEQILVGLYRRSSGERLPVLAGRGEVVGGTAVVISPQHDKSAAQSSRK